MDSVSLFKGEFALKDTPKTVLDDGRTCVPQHYLHYRHTLLSVEELILELEYSDHYPIFACQDESGIYLQVGIIGADNYPSNADCDNSKIVYGRKWRVEPQLPTSEIIQTAFLAIKKAREHEIREKLRLTINGKVTTPFNNHQDINILSNSSLLNISASGEVSCAELQNQFDNISYDHASFFVHNIEQRRVNYWLIELEIVVNDNCQQAEMNNNQFIILMVNKLTFNEVLYQTMEQLIQLSDRHVDENFKFLGVARFSREHCLQAIAQTSANTRLLHKSLSKLEFEQNWLKSNYETDLTRVPHIKSSPLTSKIREQLASFGEIKGVLPKY
ncbi:hypothetical protein A9Q74_07825 [Colwellia sp. 39_35_sub15_T18]|nr:hypothetical protein A9Q74_07825 [Colwellia sp. 39_35_sub15_T18]